MLLDPAGTRPPSIKKGKLGNQGQGQALSVTNMNAMNGMAMMGMTLGMNMGMSMTGVPGIPGMPTMSMPMYPMPMSMPIMPGVPGMPPLVAVNNGMGPILSGSVGEGSGKTKRPSSTYDMSAEFGQMQVSMKRAQSSAPALASAHGSGSGKSGTVSSSNRRSSFLDVEQQRPRRNSTYALR